MMHHCHRSVWEGCFSDSMEALYFTERAIKKISLLDVSDSDHQRVAGDTLFLHVHLSWQLEGLILHVQTRNSVLHVHRWAGPMMLCKHSETCKGRA